MNWRRKKNRMRQRSSDNWNFRAGTWDALKTELIDFEGDYPLIGSPSTPDFQGVCTANDYKAYSDSGLVSMFVDDYILERFWNNPEKYIPKMKGCAAVMSPDFSLFIGMPEPMLRWNVYRNRLVGYVWEKAGAVVVPTISWADESSFEYCFEGVRKGSVVAVSNTGCKTAEHRAFFDRGYQAMISALAPSKILFQCSGRFRAEYQAENVTFIDSFFQKKRKSWAEEAGKV